MKVQRTATIPDPLCRPPERPPLPEVDARAIADALLADPHLRRVFAAAHAGGAGGPTRH